MFNSKQQAPRENCSQRDTMSLDGALYEVLTDGRQNAEKHIVPVRGTRGRQTGLTRAILLQQPDLRMWQNKNLLLFNCRCLGEDL